MKDGKGESHRIYWQQWPTTSGYQAQSSRRDLITSSAAIRISPSGACANDVTSLLSTTLNLGTLPFMSENSAQQKGDQVSWAQDSLVLVGTLYSLPSDYVRFQHESPEVDDLGTSKVSSSSDEASVPSMVIGYPIASSSDPFHVVKTLSPNDNPLKVRDTMVQHLRKLQAKASSVTSPISPKLQWFFVPGESHPKTPIPSYIDLEGYSTPLEDDDESDYDYDDDNNFQYSDSDIDGDVVSTQTHHLSVVDALLEEEAAYRREYSAKVCNATPDASMDSPPLELSQLDQRVQKENERAKFLSLSQAGLKGQFLSGYLLKQSRLDPHAWRRVHCSLINDHLWCVSRTYDPTVSLLRDEDENNEERELNHETSKQCFSMHSRVRLDGAALIEPSPDKPTSSLFRTPLCFEIVCHDGVSHIFRATSRNNYSIWVDLLSAKIVECYENNLMEHAELIVVDATKARNKRLTNLAVKPLWEAHSQSSSQFSSEGYVGENGHNKTSASYLCKNKLVLTILRFGMEVADYREQCRHAQAMMPAKQPVFALENLTPPRTPSGTNLNDHSQNHEQQNGVGKESLDPAIRAMIRDTWELAGALLAAANRIVLELKKHSTNDSMNGSNCASESRMPNRLETLCRHVDYVLTGSFRKKGDDSGNNDAGSIRRYSNGFQDPSPLDLFDPLLAELQKTVANTTKSPSSNKRSIDPT